MTQGTGLRVHAEAVQRLGERWLPELDEGDFVCSPAGLWLALAAVASGARTETADELAALLGVAGQDAAHAVTEAARELAGTDALAVATRVWSVAHVYREFREALPDIGFETSLDWAGMDAWVREATRGMIKELPPLDVDDDTMLVLVSALVLQARWQVPFEPAQTRDLPFRDATGAEHLVPTMRRQLRRRHEQAWTVQDDATDGGTDGGTYVVELPCQVGEGGGEPARVRFVLGAQGASAADVLPLAWAPAALRKQVEADEISLALPRFALRTTVRVKPQLPALGVVRATSDADFSGLSPERLHLSDVVQEAVIEVAELGVKAAAVTVVAMPRSAPRRPQRIVRIAFDRPFGVVVLDASGEVPLFTAWQSGRPEGP